MSDAVASVAASLSGSCLTIAFSVGSWNPEGVELLDDADIAIPARLGTLVVEGAVGVSPEMQDALTADNLVEGLDRAN